MFSLPLNFIDQIDKLKNEFRLFNRDNKLKNESVKDKFEQYGLSDIFK